MLCAVCLLAVPSLCLLDYFYAELDLSWNDAAADAVGELYHFYLYVGVQTAAAAVNEDDCSTGLTQSPFSAVDVAAA